MLLCGWYGRMNEQEMASGRRCNTLLTAERNNNNNKKHYDAELGETSRFA